MWNPRWNELCATHIMGFEWGELYKQYDTELSVWVSDTRNGLWCIYQHDWNPTVNFKQALDVAEKVGLTGDLHKYQASELVREALKLKGLLPKGDE